MIVEKQDKHSGAILFKKDRESREFDKAKKEIESLQARVDAFEKVKEELENRVKALEKLMSTPTKAKKTK